MKILVIVTYVVLILLLGLFYGVGYERGWKVGSRSVEEDAASVDRDWESSGKNFPNLHRSRRGFWYKVEFYKPPNQP